MFELDAKLKRMALATVSPLADLGTAFNEQADAGEKLENIEVAENDGMLTATQRGHS